MTMPRDPAQPRAVGVGLPNLPCLSIMQPWAWLIASGHKDVENRSWPTRFRGRFLIHAGKRPDKDAWVSVEGGRHPVTGYASGITHPTRFDLGGIIGEAEIVDCVDRMSSAWFVGQYGFVIRNARTLPFVPCRGALGFFRPDFGPAAPALDISLRPARLNPQTDLFDQPSPAGPGGRDG